MTPERVLDGPLRGVRAIDFSAAAAGPVSMMYLSMLGADVVKVEPPSGDPVRHSLPPQQGMGTTFLGNNLGKRGVVLDLKDEAGLSDAKRLIRGADVVLDNFRSGAVLKRLGLGYSVMSELNPRIVYVQSSAYGDATRFQGMVSNEWIAQAISGFAQATGDHGGSPQLSSGTAYFDWCTALVNLQAVLAGLAYRRRTGVGTMVETSQYGATICVGVTRFLRGPGRLGSESCGLVPDLVVECLDGEVAVSAAVPVVWRKLCELLGLDIWAHLSLAERLARLGEINQLVRRRCAADTTSALSERLEAAGVPYAVVDRKGLISAHAMVEDQAADGDLLALVNSRRGPVLAAKPPWHFSRTAAAIRGPSPELGEHQQEILKELGDE